ncbi:MAG: FAD-dependent monooxygenase [Myxococcota bacterium]
MDDGPPTVIVGAGPTGATLALLLARQGRRVVLLDRETSFDRVFRGEGLMPSGVAALRSLALGARLDPVPQRIIDDVHYFVDRDPLMSFEEPDRGSPDAIRVLSQPHLLAAIVDAARAHPGFTFRPGVAVRDVTVDDGRPTVVTTDGEAIRAALVVGADGRTSLVRAKSGLTLDRTREESPLNHDALWCAVPLPDWLAERTGFYAFLGRGEVGTMYPTATGELRVGWLFPRSRYDEVRRARPHPLDEVARLAPPHLADWLRGQDRAAAEPALFKVMLGLAPRWWRPGVLLLGDAAHPMNAIRAQGINLGLRDAIAAARHLGPALATADPAALDAACAAVQAARVQEIDRAQALQLRIAALPAVLHQRWFRRWVFRPLVALGIPQRVQVRIERVLRDGL